jgi:O-antigen/teichoic acid export membrane protein
MNIKALGQNTLLYAVGNIGVRLASFLLIPLYTYSLNISDYGLLVTLLLTTQLLITVIGMGTPTGFMRFSGKDYKAGSLGELIGSTILIQMLAGLCATTLCGTFLLSFFQNILHTIEVREYLILSGFGALSQSLFLHIISYYRLTNQGFRYMLGCILAFAVLLSTSFIFLRILHLGITGALLAPIVTYGALWLAALFLVLPTTGIKFRFHLTRKLFSFSYPLVFAAATTMLSDLSAVYLLSYLRGLEQVSIYSLGYKIASISGNLLILPFQLAYEPFVYGNTQNPEIRSTIAKILTYLLLSFAFVAFLVVFVARDLIHVIAPPEYFSAYPIVFFMLPAIALRGVYYIGESLLNIVNRTRFVGTSVSLITILGIGLNCLLINTMGLYGAVIGFNIISISVAMALMVGGMKSFPIPLEWKRLVTSGALTIFLLGSVFLLHDKPDLVYYFSTLAIACSCVVFIFFGYFCDLQERAAIKALFSGIQSRFTG